MTAPVCSGQPVLLGSLCLELGQSFSSVPFSVWNIWVLGDQGFFSAFQDVELQLNLETGEAQKEDSGS